MDNADTELERSDESIRYICRSHDLIRHSRLTGINIQATENIGLNCDFYTLFRRAETFCADKAHLFLSKIRFETDFHFFDFRRHRLRVIIRRIARKIPCELFRLPANRQIVTADARASSSRLENLLAASALHYVQNAGKLHVAVRRKLVSVARTGAARIHASDKHAAAGVRPNPFADIRRNIAGAVLFGFPRRLFLCVIVNAEQKHRFLIFAARLF